MSPVSKYNLSVFREKFVVSGVDEDDLNSIYLWWQTLEKRTRWVARFKMAVEGLSDRTLEKKNALEVFSNCDLRFSRINEMLEFVINLPSDNILEKFSRPLMSFIGKNGPRAEKIKQIASSIREFENRWETKKVDQILAISEAINASGLTKVDDIRMKTAQWGFEELMRNFLLLELKVKFGEIDMPTTVDDLETEKKELSEALLAEPWDMDRTNKFHKQFIIIRKAMDTLDFETEVKRGFRRAYEFAAGVTGQYVSAIELLQNIENVWQGFVNDSTLERYWEWEHEEAEE